VAALNLDRIYSDIDIMADTTVQRKVEKWIREEFLPKKLGQHFQEAKVPLIWGGSFNFDAVSDDGKIVAKISTSKARMANKKAGIGKFHKIIADTFYLLNARGVERLILVFTEPDMRDEFVRRREIGRFPPEVELLLVDDSPIGLRHKLEASRKVASMEVEPRH
jgi:DUF2075 family protein